MRKLFVVIGESGSGKTTLVNNLVKKYPEKFQKVVTCTSRAPREGEVEGEDYYFLPREYFNNNPNLVLAKHPENGVCYGTRKSDLCSETHHLLLASKPSGVQKLMALGFTNIVVIRMKIEEDLKIKRMRQRGDSEQMILERSESDASITQEVNFSDKVTIIEIDASQSLEKKTENIVRAC